MIVIGCFMFLFTVNTTTIYDTSDTVQEPLKYQRLGAITSSNPALVEQNTNPSNLNSSVTEQLLQLFLIQCVPIATEPGISLIILTQMKILQRNLNRSTFVVWEMKRNVSVVRVCSVCLQCVSVVCVCVCVCHFVKTFSAKLNNKNTLAQKERLK